MEWQTRKLFEGSRANVETQNQVVFQGSCRARNFLALRTGTAKSSYLDNHSEKADREILRPIRLNAIR